MLLTAPWLPQITTDYATHCKINFQLHTTNITWHDSKIMKLSVLSEISLIAEFNRKNDSTDFYLSVAVDLNRTYRKAISPTFTSRITWLIEHAKAWSLKNAVKWKLSWTYTPLGESSGFQVTGMIEWGQKSKPPKILRSSLPLEIRRPHACGTPSGRENLSQLEFVSELRKTGFCEGGCK